MVKKALAFVAFLGISISLSASDSFLEFEGGIGVIPVQNVSGTGVGVVFPDVTRNVVRTVNPGGAPWTIRKLKAEVEFDGSIKVKGKGLLLAGTNNIGTTAGVSVFATLICEAAAPFTLHNTSAAGVPLAPDGDFRIDDVLTPALPLTCASPVLLIRATGATDGWLAAGIVEQEDDDEDDD